MAETRALSVLVVGRFHDDSVGLHIAETLRASGHQVHLFETRFRSTAKAGPIRKRVEAARTRVNEMLQGVPAARVRFWKRMVDTAGQAGHIDLSIVTHDYLQPDEVARLRDATGGPVAMWFPDAISRFGRAWFLNAPYDGLFFKDPYSVEILRRALDKPVYYLPEAFNPQRLDAEALSAEQEAEFGCDICTAGNLYSYRAAFFEALQGRDVRIWGNPPPLWMKVDAIRPMIQNRYLINADKARAFRAAKLCINNLNPAEIYGLNARTFEIAGAGGFQLIDWRPTLQDLFVDGEEIVSFASMDDLLAKIDHYLAAPEERRRIAEAGRARARRDHSFERRLGVLLDTTLGDGEGFPMPEIEMQRRNDASATPSPRVNHE